MATKIVMEALSPTMEEGRLVTWTKREGDTVAPGDVLAEVETDKAVMELVARGSGVLLRQLVPAGSTVPVASVVGWIGEAGEAIPDGAPAAAPQPTAPTTAPTTAAPPPATPAPAPTPPPAPAGRVKASPLARRMAAARGVELGAIAGTGPEGRIIKRDVEAIPASGPRPVLSSGPDFTDTPLTQIRKTIARRLAQSIGPVPTFYLTTEVDMERTAEAREALNASLGDRGKISFNDILIHTVATALRQHPACNAWWQDDRIRTWHRVHLGMAVAMPEGLITPVLRDADQKGLLAVSAESRDLATRARARKLTPEEYTGATFSISNLGMFDIDEFTAIINPPEAGIIAAGRIVQAPAVVEGRIVPRRRMRLTMSCDHRVIDGATGAAFLRTVKQFLENPLALVL